MAFITGGRTSFSEVDGHIQDLSGIEKYLKETRDGVGLLKKIGLNGFTAQSVKHEWNENVLPVDRETVTIDDSAVTLTVADAYVYKVGDLIRMDDEVVRVTALASATTLTITRAYIGSAAAHSSKVAINLGSANVENSTVGAGIESNPARVYNYTQIFDRVFEVSATEEAIDHTGGKPLAREYEMAMYQTMRLFANAFTYGLRLEDDSNKIHVMGGLDYYISTNVTAVGGALTVAAIDAEILQIVQAGGTPNVLYLSPYQKQKLDALDASKQIIYKQSPNVAGNPMVDNYQSGILPSMLEIFVDNRVKNDELFILDTNCVSVGPLQGRGWNLMNATTPGTDGHKRRIIGEYTMEVNLEKGMSKLETLS